MRLFSTLVAVGLLVAVVAAPMLGDGPFSAAISHEHPAGCHSDGHPRPVSGSDKHVCCWSGHEAMLVRRSFTRESSLPRASDRIERRTSNTLAGLSSGWNLSDPLRSPPSDPLRI